MKRQKRGVIAAVILLLFSLFSASAFAESGCFSEPSFVTFRHGCEFIDRALAEDACSEGGTLSAAATDACMQDYFSANTQCGALDICTSNPGTWCGAPGDTCNTVTFQAECIDRSQWIPINPDGSAPAPPARCTPGCCVCASGGGQCPRDTATGSVTFKTQEECQAFCSDPDGLNAAVDRFETGLDVNGCTVICNAGLSTTNKTITGRVFDDGTSQPLGGATVSAWSVSTTTTAQGNYELRDLPLGETLITASHPIYVTKHQLLTASSVTADFRLQRSQFGAIRGTVKSTAGVAIADATVTAEASTPVTVRTARTSATGTFEISSIPFGIYTVTARHPAFDESAVSATISQTNPIASIPFQLTAVPQATIRVTVRDKNSNTPLSFASVVVDSIRTHTDATGTAQIIVQATAAGVTKTVSVTHSDFVSAAPQVVTIRTGETKDLLFELVPVQRECSPPVAKPVKNFNAKHVQGKEAVELVWEKPCLEVSGYVISRRLKPASATSNAPFEQIAVLSSVSGVVDPTSYVDTAVEWGKQFEYAIVAFYNDGSVRNSEERRGSITLGNALCEDKFGNSVVEFCSADGKKRKQCNDQNQIVPATSPGERDCSRIGVTSFCSVTAVNRTTCRDAGICASATKQIQGPFGLWFNSLNCYGAASPSSTGVFLNFCTLDKARSGTIFEECISCAAITSCFDYMNKDACQINNCRASGSLNCKWDETSAELDFGQCVPENHRENDHCVDCSKPNTVFQSPLCTADVCTSLGACFARADETECIACIDGQSSCYDFESEKECRGGGLNPTFIGAVYRESVDTCSIGRCAWDGTACFKDGDANGQDDCLSLGTSDRCRVDAVPPVTTATPAVIKIGELTDKIAFKATGEPRSVYACIDRTNDCVPDVSSRIDYVELITSQFEAEADVAILGFAPQYSQSTRDYFVRFYSDDTFSNNEDVQSRGFTADLDAPVITIENSTVLNRQGSRLTFRVTVDERVNCTDLLSSGPAKFAPLINQHIGTAFVAEYTVPDGAFDYSVTCIDDFGNENTEPKLGILVDADDFINVISPPSAIRSQKVTFEIETSDPSTCELVDPTSGQRELLRTNSTARIHTSVERTLTANRIFTNFEAVCTEFAQFGSEVHRRVIVFSIDREPPRTSVRLTSKDGLIQTKEGTGWTARMNSDVTVKFICVDQPQSGSQQLGFGCDKTLVCADKTSATCTPKETTLPLVVTETTNLCYFSKDKDNNLELRNCGSIVINDDFGIEFVQPPFGVSAVPVFDIQIKTQTPSNQCKWVAAVPVAPAFSSIVAARNIFQKTSASLFRIDNFHTRINFQDGVLQEIMVICNSTTSVISPPQRFIVGFDTTPPRVTKAVAEPAFVVEGNSVDFVVETTEPTLCKFGKGLSFNDLTGKFNGFDDKFFVLEHRATLPLTAVHDNLAHEFNVSCMNHAQLPSLVALLRFQVNFSSAGS